MLNVTHLYNFFLIACDIFHILQHIHTLALRLTVPSTSTEPSSSSLSLLEDQSSCKSGAEGVSSFSIKIIILINYSIIDD